MYNLNSKEIWFVTGSQHLYGPDTLLQVAADSKAITEALDNSQKIPVRIVFKPVLKDIEGDYTDYFTGQKTALSEGLKLTLDPWGYKVYIR